MKQHCSKYFARRHALDPGLGLNVKTLFSESSHVEYHIKGNGEKNTMRAHILSLHKPSTTAVVSKDQNIWLSCV